MRVAPLAAQPRTLLDAEALLLVDDSRRQMLEFNAFLDERVRANHDIDRAVRQAAVNRLALGLAETAGEQRDDRLLVAREVLQGGAKLVIVLLRQDAGGRHQRCLPAIEERQSQRHEGHGRLARANIALQQTRHRGRFRHVAANLADGIPLGVGEVKVESALDEGVQRLVGDRQRRAG